VLTKEQDDNKADVISESYGWGDPSDVQDANHQIHALMSAEGITYLCASGDEGAGELTQVPYPDDDPDILVVGGTMATTDSTGNRTSEVVWNNNYTAWGIAPPWGTGTGGYSVDPAQCNTGLPAYQKLGTKGVPTNILHRLIPDIAANAGGPGTDSTQIAAFVEFIGGNEYISAGTSCASPLMAGGFGIAEQKLISLGALSADSHGHYRFGRINDLLYSQNQRSDVWFDVVSGTSGQMPNGNQAQAGVGWDFASGLGAINFDAFVNTMLLKLSLSPASVIAGKTTTGTVTLSSAAPTGGTVVTLSSSSANATVPASITVAAGSTSGTFTVTTKAGSPSYSSIIKATANGATQTATLYVSANGLTAFTLNPTTVTGGKTSTGTLTIGNPAPAGGWAVKLTSSDSSQVTVPASVTVAAGATTATFTATTVTYTADYASTITASDASSTKTATLQVLGNSVTGLTLNPTSVIGGTPVTGTVTIASPAPTGGYAVKLAPSNSAYATVPATVTVAAGAKTATFTVTTLATGSTVSVTITASDAVSSKTATLSVMGDKITSVIVTPNNAKSGTSVTGKVTLSSAAPSVGWVVKLTSSSTAASVPSSITVPSGATAANFTVTSTPQSSTITVTITASDILTSKTASLKLGGDSISSLALSPSTVPGGASSTGTVTLTSAAPTGGWLVNLSSSNSAVTVPVSVTVAAGATTATFTATTKVTGGSYTSTIKASDALSSKTATLTVTGGTLASLSFSPNNLVGGQQTTGTVKLTTPAPTGGVVVTLSSGSSLAQVPGTVTVQAGSITAIFVVQTSPSSSNALVTVTASDSANSVSATIGIES
jgi:subtilase family serine protease